MGDAADDAERRADWEREEYGDGGGLRVAIERLLVAQMEDDQARAAEPRPKVCKCVSCRCEKGEVDG